jgi:hypothetical protein
MARWPLLGPPLRGATMSLPWFESHLGRYRSDYQTLHVNHVNHASDAMMMITLRVWPWLGPEALREISLQPRRVIAAINTDPG